MKTAMGQRIEILQEAATPVAVAVQRADAARALMLSEPEVEYLFDTVLTAENAPEELVLKLGALMKRLLQ
jgi:hypothetical protein